MNVGDIRRMIKELDDDIEVTGSIGFILSEEAE